MFGALDISTSGLVAQRIRLDTVAGNMLNAHTTLGPDQAYQRRVPVFSVGRSGDPADGPGVHVAEIVVDQRPGELVYDPDHIHAIKSGEHEGMVRQPNVNVLEEYVNGMLAVRAYEVNIAALNATKAMATAALRLLG